MTELSLSQAKSLLRQELQKRRTHLTVSQRRKFSRIILRRVIASRLFSQSRTIAVYINFGCEVETRGLIEAAWRRGKTVLLPNTRNGFQCPTFVRYEKGDPLVRTPYGPLELANPRPSYPSQNIDLIIVPGLAFDFHGRRLGFGGGVYDRLLKKAKNATFFGIFFTSQLCHRVPVNAKDVLLNRVFTEEVDLNLG